MTSTNDGKDVKSNQSSGQKGKSYYIELYKSLDAGLNSECDLRSRTRHLCEAWRRVHGLCLHALPATHTHLLNWLQKHTSKTILQTEWQSPKSKDEQTCLAEAIDAFISQCEAGAAGRDGGAPPWENQLQQRGKWFKRVLANPWGHPVLRALLDPQGAKPGDDDILEWLKEERGVMFVTRLRQLAASKCDDLAMALVTAVMDRVRAGAALVPDNDQAEEPKDKRTTPSDRPTFADILKTEAGFTLDVWELLTDMEFVLLHKADRNSKCIELAKQTPLRNGYMLVDRLQSRLESSPREKKLWKNAKDVATLVAQVVIARCMVVPVCAHVTRTALVCCTRALVRLLPAAKLPAAAAALAAPAATARHLHALAQAVDAQLHHARITDMKPFVCELYVRAITAGMNELERHKLKTEKEAEARLMEQTLSAWFMQLGILLSASARVQCECTLTAFSVHPAPDMYDKIKAAPPLAPVALDPEDTKQETTSEFGSWTTDSRTQSNLVKTSETLNIKQTQKRGNVMSTAILTEGEAIGLSPELCQDLAVLLSGPRVKTLSWDMDREILLENCRTYMERTHGGTRALTTELKYLNLDPASYMHLPEEGDDENDLYYGIEKGYEHLVELPEPEDVWEHAFDLEQTESACSSSIEIETVTVKRKKKVKQLVSSGEDSDPLSLIAEVKKTETKKERPHSKERSNKEPSKERKKKSKPKDESENKEGSRERRKEKPENKEKKEKKPRKKKTKEQEKQPGLPIEAKPGSLSSLIGMKVSKVTIPEGKYKKNNTDTKVLPCITDSDYDSQGKSSLASLNSEGNDPDVLFDGLFNMEDYKSPEKDPLDERHALSKREISFANGKIACNAMRRPELNARSQVGQSIKSSQVKPATVTNVSNTTSNPNTPGSVNSVREEVKSNITKLIEFRRQKSLLESQKNMLSASSTTTTSHVNGSATPTYKPPNAIIRSEFPDPPLITSPKALVVPEIPKAYINKSQSDHIKDIKQEFDNLLNAKYTNKPVIQFANKYMPPQQSYNDAYQSLLQHSRPDLYPQTHPPVQSSAASKDALLQKNLQDFLKELQESINAGTGANKVANPSVSTKKPPRKEIRPMSRVVPVIPKNLKVDPGPPPLCAKSTTPTTKKAEQLNNQLNTFSRLSYMHKNKQADIKLNKVNDNSLIKYQDQMLSKAIEEQKAAKLKLLQTKGDLVISRVGNQNSQKTLLKNDAKVLVRTVAKPSSSTVKDNNPTLANYLSQSNASHGAVPKDLPKQDNQLRTVAHQMDQQRSTTPVTRAMAPTARESALCEKDQNDLLLLLRQQNKLNSPALYTNTDVKRFNNLHYPNTTVSNNPNATYNNQVPPSRTVIKNYPTELKINNIKNYDNYAIKTVPVETVVHNTYPKTIESKSENVIQPSFTKSSSLQNKAADSVMNTSVSTNPVTQCAFPEEPEPKPQDWERVMNELLQHKTPSRGPKALDIALKKDSFTNSSLRNQRIMRTNQVLDETKTDESSKPQKPIIAKHVMPTVIQKRTNHVRSAAVETVVKKNSPIQTEVIKNPNKHQEVEQPRRQVEVQKKTIPSVVVKEKDIGIPNSDYDLLDELMDDELRQEIGELSSDEEAYRTPAVNLTQGVKNVTSNRPTNLIKNATPHDGKFQAVDLRSGIKPTRDTRNDTQALKQSAPKIIVDSRSHTVPSTPVKTINKATEPRALQTPQNITLPCSRNVIQQTSNSSITNQTNEKPAYNVCQNIRGHINMVDPRNVLITTVPQTVVPKVVVVGTDLMYDPFISMQTQLQTGLCNVSQTPIVLNPQPNLTLYQTTQFSAPVVNEVIIGNAMTMHMPVGAPENISSIASKQSQQTSIINQDIEETNCTNVIQDCSNDLLDKKEINANNICVETKPTHVEEAPLSKTGPRDDIKTSLDINCNKNSERKVLSEVQDKQTISLPEKVEVKVSKSQKLPETDKNEDKTPAEIKIEKEIKVQPEDISKKNVKDQERIREKRIAILNREINVTSREAAIPLGFAPLIKQISSHKKLGSQSKSKLDISDSILKDTKTISDEQDKVVSSNLVLNNTKVNDEQDTDNSKENEGKSTPCRRILLRSSNDLKAMTVSSNPQDQRNPIGRKTKVRLKKTAAQHTENIILSKNDHVEENSNEDKDLPKRVSKRILRKKGIKESKETVETHVALKKTRSKKKKALLNDTKNIGNVMNNQVTAKTEQAASESIQDKTESNNVDAQIVNQLVTPNITNFEVIDIEDALSCSKIPKTASSLDQYTKKTILGKKRKKVVKKKKSTKKVATPEEPIEKSNEIPEKMQSTPTEPSYVGVNKTISTSNVPVKTSPTIKAVSVTKVEAQSSTVNNSITDVIKTWNNPNITIRSVTGTGLNNQITQDSKASPKNTTVADAINKQHTLNTASKNETSLNKLTANVVNKATTSSLTCAKSDQTDKTLQTSNVPLISSDKAIQSNTNKDSKSLSNTVLRENTKTTEKSNKTKPIPHGIRIWKKKELEAFKERNIINDKKLKTTDKSRSLLKEIVPSKTDAVPIAQNNGISKNGPPSDQPKNVDLNNSHNIPNADKPTLSKSTVNKSSNATIQSIKDNITIVELPPPPDMPDKKCVRIKLPNGKTFKATVFGKMHVSFESLFSDPTMRAAMLNNINDTKRYTVNIKQVSTAPINDPSKIVETRIEEVNVQTSQLPMETVNLLSDDEDEPAPKQDKSKVQSVKTEFGEFKISNLDENNFNKHQEKLQLKTFIKLTHVKFNSTIQEKSIVPGDSGQTRPEAENIKSVHEICITPKTGGLLPSAIVSNNNTDDKGLSVYGLKNDIKEENLPLANVASTSQNKDSPLKITPADDQSISSSVKENDVIEIDDSSNDSLDHTKTVLNNSTMYETVRAGLLKPIETTIEECVKKPIEGLNELKNLLLQDLGVALGHNDVHSKPDDCSTDSIASDETKKPCVKLRECYVQLTNCDDLAEKYEQIRIMNQKCTVDLFRCDENTANSVTPEHEEELDLSDDFINIDAITSEPKLTRSGSFSILDELYEYGNVESSCNNEYERNSPVMEVFETISSLRKSMPAQRECLSVMEVFDIIASFKRPTMAKIDVAEKNECVSDWYTTKRELHASNRKKLLQTQSNINDIPLFYESTFNSSVERTFKAIPTLKALTLKLFQDYDILNLYKPYFILNNDVIESPSHKLKRKIRYGEEANVACKVLKVVINTTECDSNIEELNKLKVASAPSMLTQHKPIATDLVERVNNIISLDQNVHNLQNDAITVTHGLPVLSNHNFLDVPEDSDLEENISKSDKSETQIAEDIYVTQDDTFSDLNELPVKGEEISLDVPEVNNSEEKIAENVVKSLLKSKVCETPITKNVSVIPKDEEVEAVSEIILQDDKDIISSQPVENVSAETIEIGTCIAESLTGSELTDAESKAISFPSVDVDSAETDTTPINILQDNRNSEQVQIDESFSETVVPVSYQVIEDKSLHSHETIENNSLDPIKIIDETSAVDNNTMENVAVQIVNRNDFETSTEVKTHEANINNSEVNISSECTPDPDDKTHNVLYGGAKISTDTDNIESYLSVVEDHSYDKKITVGEVNRSVNDVITKEISDRTGDKCESQNETESGTSQINSDILDQCVLNSDTSNSVVQSAVYKANCTDDPNACLAENVDKSETTKDISEGIEKPTETEDCREVEESKIIYATDFRDSTTKHVLSYPSVKSGEDSLTQNSKCDSDINISAINSHNCFDHISSDESDDKNNSKHVGDDIQKVKSSDESSVESAVEVHEENKDIVNLSVSESNCGIEVHNHTILTKYPGIQVLETVVEVESDYCCTLDRSLEDCENVTELEQSLLVQESERGCTYTENQINDLTDEILAQKKLTENNKLDSESVNDSLNCVEEVVVTGIKSEDSSSVYNCKTSNATVHTIEDPSDKQINLTDKGEKLSTVQILNKNSLQDLNLIEMHVDRAETESENVVHLSQIEPCKSKIDNEFILKGIEYDDPVEGTCYVFPIAETSSCENDDIYEETEEIIQVIQEIGEDGTVGNVTLETKEVYSEDTYFTLKLPKFTYSRNKSAWYLKNRRPLKRKIDMSDIRVSEKKYRKGKNIDYSKKKAATMMDSAYSREFKRVIDYCSTLKFSFTQPFHKEFIDVDEIIRNWPLETAPHSNDVEGEFDNDILFCDLDNIARQVFNPVDLSLADELSADYSEPESPSSNVTETNFNKGFGEGSDRVIQNLEEVGDDSKLSAATLSDVKQPQPFSMSEDEHNFLTDQVEISHKARNDQKNQFKRYLTYIQLRDKVRSFFKKTSVELKQEWMKQDQTRYSKCDSLSFPFDLYNTTDFIEPSPANVVVQVVQVGQLPVSAAAQNPVTCDPRVTQVSDASPSQCSVDNSPQDDSQPAIKTEYTELTTADLSVPLMQEYVQHNQTLPMESHEQSNMPMTDENIPIETEIKSVVKIELMEEPEEKDELRESYEHCEPQNLEAKHENNVDYSFDANSANATPNLEPEAEYQGMYNNTGEKQDITEAYQTEHEQKQNGAPEKTDQIAHAMNAAGITTTSETMANTTRAHALVNILSQKLRQGSVGGTQAATNNYPKTTAINAMALQQALAQILPPPLNQTNATENNQQTPNTQVTPQVLHIVQGKNATGSQITLVDNSQQSVINTPNATPVLHIVQNKSGTASATSNGAPQPQTNSFGGLSLVDAGLQQGGNQLLHIVNTGSQKNSTAAGQLLKRVNLLTNLTNVQGSNEQKMVQFVCKSADGKSIQLNAPHQRSMVLRLQPIETPNVQSATPKPEGQDLSPSTNATNSISGKDNAASQQEIKSRSVYEENYAKFIQNSSNKTTGSEKATSLPKFNQAFGKPVFQDGNQNQNDMNTNNSHLSVNTKAEPGECQATDNAINLDHIGQISSPPLLLRKSPAQTSQPQANLVQQLKQTITPMNIQTMHGGVIYTRQIPVNIGGGQTINLITVPSTELVDDSGQKQQPVGGQSEIEPSIIKIVPQNQTAPNTEISSEDGSAPINVSNEGNQNPQPQPVLTQMRIKLPMLSKAPQMVSGARVVRPSFFQIQRNVIGGTNQPVYQQLVLTAAPPLGQQTIRLPQASRQIKVPTENQSSAESQMSSSTLEQLREFDMVLEQVKERSSVPPNTGSSTTFPKLHTPSSDTTDGSASSTSTETTQQVLYSIGNNHQPLNVAYVNRKATVTTPTTSTFVRSPDSSGIVDSPTSSSHVQIPHTVTTDSSHHDPPTQPKKSKSKSRPKASSNPPNNLKLNTVPPKTSAQKPLEDEQTTQRILYILAEYKEQVENSPDKDKPAPRRRSNPPSNPSGSSKRKKSSSGSRRSGRDMSPIHGEDTCRTMGSEDSSCGTSQGDCNESCLESHSPQDSPRKVVRKLTFEQETPAPTPRPQPQRNVIVADGQTITVARGTAGKPATAVLMPANYILPVSMVKGGQQIAIVTNRGPKLLTVGGGEGGATNALLLQRLIGPAGLKPVLARPGVRHVRLPTAALHNLQAFNLATATTVQPPDSTASPAPAPTPPELVDTRATSSPWTDRDTDVKPERGSSPEGSEPWHLPSSGDPHDYSYEETVRADNLDRTVLVVQKKDGSSHRQHRLTHVSAAALRHKYAILEHELRLQKSLSEECEDLGVDSPSASELFPEAELLFATSPAHDHTQDQGHHSHTPQPSLLNQSGIPQPDMDDQIATDQLLSRTDMHDEQQELNLGLEDVGIVTVSEDGMQATIALDQEEFARSHPNTTFHSEPEEGEVQQPFTIAGLKGRHITSTIFHSNRAPATVLMTAPQTTVISQATGDHNQPGAVKYDIDNMINSLPSTNGNNINLSSVLVKDDGLTRFDSILNDSRELHLSNTASAIVHSAGNATQVIRRVCYDDDKRDSRFLMDEPDGLIAGDDAKMIAEDSSRDATLESMAGDVDDDRSSPERHAELFWESNSASERSESRRPLDFSSDSDKCCYDETNSTDSSGVGAHMRLDSVIKEARLERSGSADGSSPDEAHPPLRTYPPKRPYHPEARSVSGKTRAGERSPELEGRRRASGRGVVKRGCHCCNGEPAPSRPKKSRQRKPTMDFTN